MGNCVGWRVFYFVLLAYDTAEQDALHGQPFEWGSYLVTWGAAVLENLQSEWAQLLAQGLLFSVLGERIFAAATRLEAQRHAELTRCLTLLRGEVAELRGLVEPGRVTDGE